MQGGEPTEAAVEHAAAISSVYRAFSGDARENDSSACAFETAALQNGFPELDCVRGLVPPSVINAIEHRSAALGIGADRVLIGAGIIDEEAYLRALGARLGIDFDPLGSAAHTRCPLPDDQWGKAAAAGLLPLWIDHELVLVIAPRIIAARRLASCLHRDHPMSRRLRFTTARRLNAFVMGHGGPMMALSASNALKATYPMLSAAPAHRRRSRSLIPGMLIALTAAASVMLMWSFAPHALAVTLAGIFLSWLGLRLAAAFIPSQIESPVSPVSDEALPVYSIIAALYDEAASVNGLLDALECMDYPGIMAQTPQAAA